MYNNLQKIYADKTTINEKNMHFGTKTHVGKTLQVGCSLLLGQTKFYIINHACLIFCHEFV